MSVVTKAFHILRESGPGTLCFRVWAELVDRWFDYRYGVDTCRWADLGQLTVPNGNRRHGFRYEPGRVVVLRRLFQDVRRLLSDPPAVVDLGAGKGRMIMVAAEFGAIEAVGVEFAHELCEIARRNCLRYSRRSGRSTRFEIVETDAAEYEIRSNDNVFTLFNPFDDIVLQKVLDRIATSVESHPRKILICYYSPVFGDLIRDHPAFVRLVTREFRGYEYAIYANRT